MGNYRPRDQETVGWAMWNDRFWWTNGHIIIPAENVNIEITPSPGFWRVKNGRLEKLENDFGVGLLLEKPSGKLAPLKTTSMLVDINTDPSMNAKALRRDDGFVFLNTRYATALGLEFDDSADSIFEIVQGENPKSIIQCFRDAEILGAGMPVLVTGDEDQLMALGEQLKIL